MIQDPTDQRPSIRDTRGFSLAEMMIVIVMVSIFASVVSQRIGPAKDEYSVRTARTVFASMIHRARAHAVERGELVRLEIDLTGDSAWIATPNQTIDTFRFANLGVALDGIGSSMRICFNSRGFADSRCNSFSSRSTLSFAVNDRDVELDLFPLGQVVYR